MLGGIAFLLEDEVLLRAPTSDAAVEEEGTFSSSSSSSARSRRRQSSIFILRRFGMKRSSPAPPVLQIGVIVDFRFVVDVDVVVLVRERGGDNKIGRVEDDGWPELERWVFIGERNGDGDGITS